MAGWRIGLQGALPHAMLDSCLCSIRHYGASLSHPFSFICEDTDWHCEPWQHPEPPLRLLPLPMPTGCYRSCCHFWPIQSCVTCLYPLSLGARIPPLH